MPVTFHPSTQPLTSVSSRFNYAKDPLQLLQQSTGTSKLKTRIGEIFQSSYTNASPETQTAGRFAATDLDRSLISPPPNGNGLVDACLAAYNQHHHLVLRPDDIWLAILTQFSLYVNAHAEEVRHLFVGHQGRKELTVRAGGSRHTVDFGGMADQMRVQMQANVVDGELGDWLMPHFSTTTFNDRIVAAVVMMATLQQYFAYKFCLLCGLPAVTLLGERADWEALRAKVDKLPSYGPETAQWAALLRPVLARFVAAFEKPEARANLDFWQRIVHYEGGGSGPRYLSGWITAFCFFDEKGKSLYGPIARLTEREVAKVLAKYGGNPLGFELDGTSFHRVNTNDVPPGYAYVKVKLDDNGQLFDTLMVAGLVGVGVESSGVTGEKGEVGGKGKAGKGMGRFFGNGKRNALEEVEGHDGLRDTVRPEVGWWLFEDLEPGKGEKKEIEK